MLEPDRYRRLFSINSNLLLRTLALMFTFAFITAQGARMGDVILAANALLINFQYFLSYALDGIALAAEALTGKAIGSKNDAGLREVVGRTLRWSLIFAADFTGVYYVAGTQIIDLQTNIPSVQETARIYLPWLIASPLISVWSFFYDGVFVGATRSREMRIVSPHDRVRPAGLSARLVHLQGHRQSGTLAGIHVVHGRARRRDACLVPVFAAHQRFFASGR